MWKMIFLIIVLGCLIFLLIKLNFATKEIERAGSTVVDSTASVETPSDASVTDVVSADAGAPTTPAKVRPTAQQLAKEFILMSDLKDLLEQAKTPEDKQLIQDAINIKLQRIKDLELSSDFETNMNRALK